jgi:hypothetical protein
MILTVQDVIVNLECGGENKMSIEETVMQLCTECGAEGTDTDWEECPVCGGHISHETEDCCNGCRCCSECFNYFGKLEGLCECGFCCNCCNCNDEAIT